MNYLVFDIGGTAIKYALMTETCEFLEKGEIPSYSNDFDDFLSKLEDIFNNYFIMLHAQSAVSDRRRPGAAGKFDAPAIHG